MPSSQPSDHRTTLLQLLFMAWPGSLVLCGHEPLWLHHLAGLPQQSRANRVSQGHPAMQPCPTTGMRGKHGFREAEASAGMFPALSSSPSPSCLANMLKWGRQRQPHANGVGGTSSSPVTHGPVCQTLVDTVIICRLVKEVQEWARGIHLCIIHTKLWQCTVTLVEDLERQIFKDSIT